MKNKPANRTAEENRKLVLRAAAGLFIQKGYTATSLREISRISGVNMGSLIYIYEHKDKILLDLVSCALDVQFSTAEKLLQGDNKDKVMLWAAEIALRLHIAEANDQMRELFIAAYSNSDIANLVYEHSAEKHAGYFQQFYPHYEIKDFYELEIAVGGIIRSYMAMPCDMYFTMDRKIRRFLEITFLIYRVPEEQIQRVIQFIASIDFEEAAQELIKGIISNLDLEEEIGA